MQIACIGSSPATPATTPAIQAAKRTSELIPLAHPLMLTRVTVGFEHLQEAIAIEVTVETTDRTGVEMEALTAASVAALTVYDMVKGIEPGTVEIASVVLVEKTK